MDPSTIKEWLDILAARDASWTTLWNVYYTVSAALIGVVAAAKIPAEFRWHAFTGLAVGFLLFAAGNFSNLAVLRAERAALVQLVHNRTDLPAEMHTIADASAPAGEFLFIVYHWGLSTFVLLIILSILLFRERRRAARPKFLAEVDKNRLDD